MKDYIINHIMYKLRCIFYRDRWYDFYAYLYSNQIEKQFLIKRIRQRLLSNNKLIHTKPIRVFIAVKNINWEKAGLVDSWSDIPYVEAMHYDWGNKYDQYDEKWHITGKYDFNEELLERVKELHLKNKINIFFSYLSGRWIFPQTIQKMSELGIITINFSFDDSQAFWGGKERTGWSGNAEIASSFDICLTAQSQKDVSKYLSVNSNPLFIIPGGNEDVFASKKPDVIRNIPLSFIGQKSKKRETIINFLQKNGIPVFTRGLGWDEGPVLQEEMLNIYKASLLTLGFGYIGNTNIIKLKGRDFEIPLTGTAYLTTYNPELSKYFIQDTEILFYKNKVELLKKIRFYLQNPEKAMSIGLSGRERALKEHTWTMRWRELLNVCSR